MVIRPIENPDIPAVARLLRVLAEEFIVHESARESAATFLRENDEVGLRGYIARGHVCHVAVIEGELAAYIAVRERSHIFHMFVARPWQRRGVARRLWEHAREVALEGGHPGVFTVNSSNFAVPVYEAFGFRRSAPMQCKNGLFYNPMELTISGAPLVGPA